MEAHMITIVRSAHNDITEVTSEYRRGGENRNDWQSFPEVEMIAAEVTAFTGEIHIGVDNGPGHYPRYDIAKVPTIGDEVSMSFNGDTYPLTKVKSVSKDFRIVTTECGKKFYRSKQTGGWRHDQTWWLVCGHHYAQNPHF
jgi:hypothetical protein